MKRSRCQIILMKSKKNMEDNVKPEWTDFWDEEEFEFHDIEPEIEYEVILREALNV